MLEKLPAALGHALSGVRPGLEKLTSANSDLAPLPDTVLLSSDAFRDKGPIPARFTEDGAKVSPPLAFANIPAGAKSLVLVVEDADSPTPMPLCHMLAWNIAPEDGGFQEAALNVDAMPTARCGAIFGINSFRSSGWLPPDPPTGHGPHRYVFQVFAVDCRPDLAEGSGRSAVVEAIRGHVIAKGVLTATYERA